MVSELRPVFPFGKMSSAGGSQNPQARPFVKKVVVRQFARANCRILAAENPVSDMTNTENDSEMLNHAQGRKLHRMAKVHNFLEMWKGNQILCATQKECRTQNIQMTAVGYISDTEQIVKASW